MAKKNVKMTLKCYFKTLSEQKTPLQAFISEVMAQTGKSEQTVRNWCLYGIKPQSYADVKVLVKLTGIEEDELWSNE